MRRLIINADDFGLTKGCNEGIISAMKDGIVTSTTVMMNMHEAEEGIRKALEEGIDKMGVHLTLTCGKPLMQKDDVLSLVDKDGKFHRRTAMFPISIEFGELEKELRAQIEKFLDTEMQLTHLDSHHHVQTYGKIKELVGILAKEYGVPVRQTDRSEKEYFRSIGVKTTDYFSMEFYGDSVSVETLKGIIDKFPEGTMEIMSHPGFFDKEIQEISSYNRERSKELKVLTSDAMKTWIFEKKH